MTSDFDALIFDLDGTLWDSTALCADAWNEAVSFLKINSPSFIAEDAEKIMGMTHAKVFETLFPNETLDVREKIAAEFYIREIKKLRENQAVLYPDVVTGLKKLNKHYPLFLVSNCQEDYLEGFFFVTGLRKIFTDSECYGNTGKPKAENLISIIRRNKIRKGVYIGDTGSDHSSSLKAGLHYIHVNYGFGEPIKECLRFNSFSELTEYFLK